MKVGTGVATTDSATNGGETLRKKFSSRGAAAGKSRKRSNHTSSMTGGILAALPSNVMPSQQNRSTLKTRGKSTSAQQLQQFNKANKIIESWSDAGGESTPEHKHARGRSHGGAGEKSVIPGSPPPANVLIWNMASSPMNDNDENLCYDENEDNNCLSKSANLSVISSLTTPPSSSIKKNLHFHSLASPTFQATAVSKALLQGGGQEMMGKDNDDDHRLKPRPLFPDDDDDRSAYSADVENISECEKFENKYHGHKDDQSPSSSTDEGDQESDDESAEIITIEDESSASSATLDDSDEELEIEIDNDDSPSSEAESCEILSVEEEDSEDDVVAAENDDENSEDYVPDESSDDSDEDLEIDEDSSNNDTLKLHHRHRATQNKGTSKYSSAHILRKRVILDSDDDEDNHDKDDDSTVTEEEESIQDEATHRNDDPLAMASSILSKEGMEEESFIVELSNALEDTRIDDDDSNGCRASLEFRDSSTSSSNFNNFCSSNEPSNKNSIDEASTAALLDHNISFMDDMSASSNVSSSSGVFEIDPQLEVVQPSSTDVSRNEPIQAVSQVIISNMNIEKTPPENKDDESSMEVMVDDEETVMNLTLSSTVLPSLNNIENDGSNDKQRLNVTSVEEQIAIVDVGHIEMNDKEIRDESEEINSVVAVVDLDESFMYMSLSNTAHQTDPVSEEKSVQNSSTTETAEWEPEDDPEDKSNDKENHTPVHASNEETNNKDKYKEMACSKVSANSQEALSKVSRPKGIRREGSVQLGKWSLGSKIGVGSFGVVHVGMNQKTGTLMAVKSVKLEKAVLKDIRREVNLLRTLDHINIVRYLGAEMNASDLHIFQEWVPGGSVASLLQKFGPFDFPVIRSYLLQIIAGLGYLHRNNILHRDIKGGNVLVNDAGVVKLADFGASRKLAQQAFEMESLTMRGTPYFMAPEVFQEKYGAKADIWSVGCVAYQMTTGLPPWKEIGFTNPMSLFVHLTKEDEDGPPPLPKKWKFTNGNEAEVSNFKALLQKCFAREPSLRPTADSILDSAFFTEIPVDEEDQSPSQSLFSPGEHSRESITSLIMSPPNTAGGKPPRTPNYKTVASPPLLPSSVRYESLTSDAISPILATSVKVDANDWPTWAKGKLTASQQNSSKDAGPSPATLNSLARSEDSSLRQENPFRRQANTSLGSISPLNGLEFLVDDGH